MHLQQGVTIWWPAPRAQLHPAAFVSLLPSPTSSLSEGKGQASVPTGASPLIPGILLMSQRNPVLKNCPFSHLTSTSLSSISFAKKKNCFEPLLRADMRESHGSASC